MQSVLIRFAHPLSLTARLQKQFHPLRTTLNLLISRQETNTKKIFSTARNSMIDHPIFISLISSFSSFSFLIQWNRYHQHWYISAGPKQSKTKQKKNTLPWDRNAIHTFCQLLRNSPPFMLNQSVLDMKKNRHKPWIPLSSFFRLNSEQKITEWTVLSRPRSEI